MEKNPKISDWQTIFAGSPVNGADYNIDNLPDYQIDWPKNTWLRRRIAEVRAKGVSDET